MTIDGQLVGVDARIILRSDTGDTRGMLESLRYAGFDTDHIRVQSCCRTKGIVEHLAHQRILAETSMPQMLDVFPHNAQLSWAEFLGD